MEIKNFVKDFEDALDYSDAEKLTENTRIHELTQMDSLMVFSIIAMMEDNYNTKIKGADVRNAVTIQDLFNLIQK